MVKVQTRLKWGEQQRVFMIPGLEKAEFVRYGVMHRNTFLKGPEVLQPSLQMKKAPAILCAGQITGVEALGRIRAKAYTDRALKSWSHFLRNII